MDKSVDEFKENFRRNLRLIRENEDLTQVELSESSGFEASYVGKLERGEADPSLESIQRLCGTLEITPAQLLLSSPEDTTDTDAKLEVREVELEMQTEHLKEREEEIRELRSQQNKLSLYQKLPTGAVTVNSKGMILNANQQFRETFCSSEMDLDDQHINEFVHPEDRDDFYRFRLQAGEQGSPDPIVVRLVDSSNSDHPREIRYSQLEDSEGTLKLLLSFNDVSDWLEEDYFSDK